MGFSVTFRLNNPHTAGAAFTFDYDAHNDGPDDPSGHIDHVEVWGTSSKPVDENFSALDTKTGETYSTTVDVPALSAGRYDVSVTIPGSPGAGSTIEVV
jgi:hypothetical protein